MNTNPEWKLVPAEPTPKMIDATWDHSVDRDGGIESQNARNRRIYAAMLGAAPEAPPLTVTVDPDARGVSVGVYQGSRCVYSGAHRIPASTQADERDWELTCEGCDGDGFVYVERRVGMCATDVQTFKEECECCEGRGFVFAFEDIPGIAEYVKSCRPASTVATEGEKDEKPYCYALETRGEHNGVADVLLDVEYNGADSFSHGRKGGFPLYRRPAPAAGDAQMLEFVREVAQQTPETPDYWSSCSQCERNTSTAEELLEARAAIAQQSQRKEA